MPHNLAAPNDTNALPDATEPVNDIDKYLSVFVLWGPYSLRICSTLLWLKLLQCVRWRWIIQPPSPAHLAPIQLPNSPPELVFLDVCHRPMPALDGAVLADQKSVPH